MAEATWGVPAHRAPGVADLARRAASHIARAAGRVARPHRRALVNLAHMPLSCLGIASVDFAAFHLAHGWGWLVTGLSLIIAEYVAADE